MGACRSHRDACFFGSFGDGFALGEPDGEAAFGDSQSELSCQLAGIQAGWPGADQEYGDLRSLH